MASLLTALNTLPFKPDYPPPPPRPFPFQLLNDSLFNRKANLQARITFFRIQALSPPHISIYSSQNQTKPNQETKKAP